MHLADWSGRFGTEEADVKVGVGVDRALQGLLCLTSLLGSLQPLLLWLDAALPSVARAVAACPVLGVLNFPYNKCTLIGSSHWWELSFLSHGQDCQSQWDLRKQERKLLQKNFHFTSMRVERKIAPWLFSRRLDQTKELHETDTSSHLPYKKEIIYARILFQVLMNNLCGFADRFSGNSVKRALPCSAWQTRVLKSIAPLKSIALLCMAIKGFKKYCKLRGKTHFSCSCCALSDITWESMFVKLLKPAFASVQILDSRIGSAPSFPLVLFWFWKFWGPSPV